MKKKSEPYIPPYKVSEEAVNLIAEISAAVERFDIEISGVKGVRLRKTNRIKTIHGSTAIGRARAATTSPYGAQRFWAIRNRSSTSCLSISCRQSRARVKVSRKSDSLFAKAPIRLAVGRL